MIATLVALALAATPSPDSDVDAGTPTDQAAPPQFEIVVPEQMLQDLLVAAAPFDRDVTRTIGAFGFNQDVKINVRLSHPKVHVAADGIHVTMDYALAGAGGIGTHGTVTPRLDLRPDPDKGDLVATLVDATLPSTGAAIPLADVMDPIHIPAGTSGPLALGSRTVDATAKATAVSLEPGFIHVKGEWSFKPAAVAKKGKK